MINHIVTFSWKDDVTEADVAAISERLRALPGKIPELDAYVFGPDLGLTEGTGDFAIVATVLDAEALRSYLEHPEHVLVAGRLREMAERRTAVQIDPGQPMPARGTVA